MDCISCHCRKVCCKNSRNNCYEKWIKYSVEYRKCSGFQVIPVLYQMRAGNRGKTCIQLCMWSGRIYKQHIEPEQAKEGKYDQNYVCYESSGE